MPPFNNTTPLPPTTCPLQRLAQATTLDEHTAALQGFDEDLTLDTPFIQIQVRMPCMWSPMHPTTS